MAEKIGWLVERGRASARCVSQLHIDSAAFSGCLRCYVCAHWAGHYVGRSGGDRAGGLSLRASDTRLAVAVIALQKDERCDA
jgi:hypothetical protein